MFSYRSVTKMVAFGLLLCVFASGCSDKGTAYFERASRYYFGCAMTPPWPIEVTNRDSFSVSFIRLDDFYSLPIYFRKKPNDSWPELHAVPETHIVNFPYASFDVKRVKAPLSSGPGEFYREFVIIIKQDAALVLPEESGDYWRVLLDTCSP